MTKIDCKKVLVIGSGALRIGQAGEFDYSGTQAIKALKEEGIKTVLINPNIATIQTSEHFADEVYFLPIEADFIEKVMVQTGVDAALLSFGGQTALNAGLELEAKGVFERLGVKVLGTPVETVRITEDRAAFVDVLKAIDVKSARSRAATSVEDALRAAEEIGYPVVLRAGFSLGGQGSAIVDDEAAAREALEKAFANLTQVLVEECLTGWKEIEYEVVRDGANNCVTVCNMENVDPMGIHTGESIVVAPSQTLDDDDYQLLRDVAIKTVRHLGVVGECNIQYALNPHTSDYRVIEVNARLSRSSALASKATGYPLAFVAAKIALGYTLPEIPNAVTGSTTAFFEPALDYLVCKIPRWDLEKFSGVPQTIGTEMKSVGEVMAIGRSFAEVIQKALRMLEIGVDGLDPMAFPRADLKEALSSPSPWRIFHIARAFAEGWSLDEIYDLTKVDGFFLEQIKSVVDLWVTLGTMTLGTLDEALFREAKVQGFSDLTLGERLDVSEGGIRSARRALNIIPRACRIDTLAGEYPAETNYLYLTYGADGHELKPETTPSVLVLGSGVYRIGSSVEFDWCAVGAINAARAAGYRAILLNFNPETVSTDYDSCDRLYFDEISLEAVLALVEFESPKGVVVSMGGQTPNTLALKLHQAGVSILGTHPESIDRAEDRGKFSALLDELDIPQPQWAEMGELSGVTAQAKALGGYPILVRPSYVLSGAAMRVAKDEAELLSYLQAAAEVSPLHPVVMTKFEGHAREMELDAVAKDGEIVLWAVSEHIEDAGVHSGDATLVLPPQRLYVETIRRARAIARRLARELKVTGPMNIQLLSRHNEVKVIELNLRASRSFPFVSKVLGVNFIEVATRALLGEDIGALPAVDPLDLDFAAVKAPQFSFGRLAGADPLLGVEMASTGEVACFGRNADEALLLAMLASGVPAPVKGVLLSLGPVGDKYRFAEEARGLVRSGLKLYGTPGTAKLLQKESISCEAVVTEGRGDGSALALLERGAVDMVINIPRFFDAQGRPDGYHIRRRAIDLGIPLLTDLWLARRFVYAFLRYSREELQVRPWRSFLRGE